MAEAPPARGAGFDADTFDVFVMFIGNSLTNANGSLHFILKELARHAEDGPTLRLETFAHIKLGQPLSEIVEAEGTEGLKNALERVPYRPGLRRVLVLQEDLPETTIEQSTRAFDQFKAANDATEHPLELVVLGCWPYPTAARPESLTEFTVEQAMTHNRAMADRLDGRLADALGAMELHKKRCPTVALLMNDKEHPEVVLSYIMACCVFAAVFNCTARVATRLPMWDVVVRQAPHPDVLSRARDVAWQAVRLEVSRANTRWEGFNDGHPADPTLVPSCDIA